MRTPKKPGRPQIEIDLDQLERLASIACTDEEIAAVLGVSVDTLGRRRKLDEDFARRLSDGRGKGRATLRRLQWQRANGGSDVMLIWLGKQLLGQRDRQDLEVGGSNGGPVMFRWSDTPVTTDVEEDDADD